MHAAFLKIYVVTAIMAAKQEHKCVLVGSRSPCPRPWGTLPAATSCHLVILEGLVCDCSTIVNSCAGGLQIISPEDMVGYSEQSKGSQITKVFEDAYKSPLSIVVLVSAGPDR